MFEVRTKRVRAAKARMLATASVVVAVVLALALLCPAQPQAAENRINSLLDAITAVPNKPGQGGSGGAGSSTARSGPTAPKPPVVPVVKPLGPEQPPSKMPSPRMPVGAPRSNSPVNPTSAKKSAKTPAKAPAKSGSRGATLSPRPPASPDAQLVLPYAGARRVAHVHLPPPVRAVVDASVKANVGKRFPLLIFLHGAGGSANQAMRQTNLTGLSDHAGFIAAFPEGLGPEGGQAWNAWGCCGYARDAKVDDVGYLAALILRLKADLPVDQRRVYLVGFSNGGMLAHRFALERPGVAAAIAVVSGGMPCDLPAEPGKADVRGVLVVHGDQDRVARFGALEAPTGNVCEDAPVRGQVQYWVRRLGLNPEPQVQDLPASPARVEVYGPARQGGGRNTHAKTGSADSHAAEVRFVVVKGGGHAWPGGAREIYRYCDMPAPAPDASLLVWDFLSRHSLPGK